MKPRPIVNADLTRRSWLVVTASAAASALTACGGGGTTTNNTSSTSTAAGAPGTGGTGIYAQGSISGFGSVILNGVKYDDAAATVVINGVPAHSLDLRLGMVASIQGQLSNDVTLGTANNIEVWSIAQGPVTQVKSSSGGAFSVAGMTVQTDSNTVFDGIANVADLSTGLRVSVWGLQVGADGRLWKATRVAAVTSQDMTVVSTGLVHVGQSSRTLNGMALTGSAADSLTDQQLVRIQGVLTGHSLAVSSVKPLGLGVGIQQQEAVEIEGFVTSTPLAGRFMLGSIDVDATNAIYRPVGARIAKDSRVEVYGTWHLGVLVASQVELEDATTLNTVEITGVIDVFTSLADFVVRGQHCDATTATISHGTAAAVKQGVKVQVKGTNLGSDLLVLSELAFED